LEIRKVIRVSEVLAVLLIGIYWLIFPNNFSEPLIIILGGLAVLIGEVVNHFLQKRQKEIILDSRAFTAIFLLVIVFACMGIYTFHYYLNDGFQNGFSPLVIIGSLITSALIFWAGFEKPILRYFELPWGYLIEENDKWKNIHSEKIIKIEHNHFIANYSTGKSYSLKETTYLNPKEKLNIQISGAYGAMKNVITKISFVKEYGD
jgi:hypothetical protein